MIQTSLFDTPQHPEQKQHSPTGSMSVQEARSELQRLANTGTVCPCCDRYLRRYKRKFNSGMARSLIWLVIHFDKEQSEGFVDVPKRAPRSVVSSREFDKISQFGCAVRKSAEDGQKRESGLWRPTAKGIDFIHGRCQIPAYMFILNGQVEGFSDLLTDIRSALSEKFDYDQLMRGE